MAKAYKRTTEGARQLYCESCDGWYDESDFEKKTVYKGSDKEWELAGEMWWGDYTSSYFYYHNECDYNAAGEDTYPNSRDAAEYWVCGECKCEYDDQEDARECCL